ncbi:MAG: type II 3-dehydroquinate dehydratase [Actinocrinis sp.]
MPSVLILNGPNLNLLGVREPAVYGSGTLADVEALCRETAAGLGLGAELRQTNHEGVLVDWIQEAGAAQQDGRLIGAVLNAGAYTHTSIALHDAIKGSGLRVVELHISNVHAREAFRQHSYISPVAAGIVVGFGVEGYPLAIQGLHRLAGARRPAG